MSKRVNITSSLSTLLSIFSRINLGVLVKVKFSLLKKFTFLLVSTLLLSSCAGGDASTSLAFKDVSGLAFSGVEKITLSECYRAIRTRDSINRPDARSLEPVEGLQIKDGKLSGDVSNISGLTFNATFGNCFAATGVPALAVGDLNGDGYDDVVKTPNVVWLNNGDATFRPSFLPITRKDDFDVGGLLIIPTYDEWPSTPVIIDVDNDGVPEIITSDRNNTAGKFFTLYRQIPNLNSDPTWVIDNDSDFLYEVPDGVQLPLQTLTALDYNNDGLTDLVAGILGSVNTNHRNRVAGSNSRGIILLKNTGKGFLDVTPTSGIDEAIDQAVDLMLHQGTITRLEHAMTLVHGVSTADLDNDGFQDLVIAGDFGTGVILWNEGGDRFTYDSSLDFSGFALMGPALTDVNGDGFLDIFVSQINSNLSLSGFTCVGGRPCSNKESQGNLWWVSQGPRKYKDMALEAGLISGGWGWGASFIDLDNDGYEELIQAAGMFNVISPTDTGYENRNDPVFLWTPDKTNSNERFPQKWLDITGLTGISIGVNSSAVASADFDRDGKVDVLIVSSESNLPYLFRNITPSTGNWVEVTPLNDAKAVSIGARVEVSFTSQNGAEKTLRRYSGTQSQSIFSNSDARLWFGVGKAEFVDVLIRYPDGTVREWLDQPVNRSHRLVR